MAKARRIEYDLNEMLDAPKAQESFALIGLIRDDNPQIMDNVYTESIIAQLKQLGSGEIFIDFALDHISSAQFEVRRKSQPQPVVSRQKPLVETAVDKALRELTAENLVHHVVHCGCVSLYDPCMYNNGPCCCEADLHIGNCPFRQGRLRLDEEFVEEQLAKLQTASQIGWAKCNIRQARSMVKQMEEEINSSIR